MSYNIKFKEKIVWEISDLAFDSSRNQYDGQKLLNELIDEKGIRFFFWIVHDDLFVPVMNFVFGLASKFYGSITSFYRLKGLEMKTKISIHECGHVLGLEHCQNYCVMQYSNSLPEAQQKPSTLCDECKKKLEQIRCNYNEDDAR